MKRFALLVTGAFLLSFTTLVPMTGVTSALADSRAITFEPDDYSTSTGVPPGSIQGQDGWAGNAGAPINPAYDQAVVSTTLTGSTQAFRMSNAVTSGAFDWPFSPSLNNEAGETSAVSGGFSGGTRQPGFQASFDFASAVSTYQEGLQVSISPDRGDGARMSYLRLRDTPDGLAVDFIDYQSGLNETGCATGDNFVTTMVAPDLSRSTTHSIKLTMDFFNGPANDIVKVYVDSTLVHTGTSWEDYFRDCELTQTRPVDSLIFQARTQYVDNIPEPPTMWAANSGKGFLFDNLNYSSGPLNKCTQTGFFRDGINMTAAQIGGNVTGSLDATGCNIGVYYDSSTAAGNVTNAEIFGANYFGVVVRGRSVNVTGTSIHDIGNSPLDGTQHGIAVYYATVGTGSATAQPTCAPSGATTGTISGNTVRRYQKGAITANCTGTSTTIKNNNVYGQGPVAYIAQNGIQIGYGAKATVTGNNVSGNQYTGTDKVSSAGILVVGGPSFPACYGLPFTTGLTITKNTLTNNDEGIWLFNCGSGTTKTNNTVKFNTISNLVVTNLHGYEPTNLAPTCGYQAGIADAGHKDLIVNNSISGFGYTPQNPDCSGTPPAFLRFVDTDSSARGVPSNK
jgi:parallel beta-helix repeat protein